MTDALLAEATRLAGPDPVGEALAQDPDLTVPEALPPSEAPPPVELDPEPGDPVGTIEPDRLRAALEGGAPGLVAEVGEDRLALATAAVGRLPRDLAVIMDQEGVFAAPATWEVLSTVGEALIAAGAGRANERVTVEPAQLERFAMSSPALSGPIRDLLAQEPHALESVALVASSLPRPVLQALADSGLQDDADLWALAAHLGGKLWGFSLPRRK